MTISIENGIPQLGPAGTIVGYDVNGKYADYTAGSGITIDSTGKTISSTGGGSGTVTSITAGTGLSGGTITTSGTIALANTTVTASSYTYSNITVDAQGRITAAASATTPLLPANNLSDILSASTARTNLGLVIGTNVEAWSATLDTIAAITPANNSLLGYSNTGVPVNVTAGTGITISGNVITASGTSGVSSITGTSNQITVSPTTGAAVASLPSAIVLPGTIEVPGTGYIQLDSSVSGNIKLAGPASATTSYTVYYPTAQGSTNSTYVNDGSGNLNFRPYDYLYVAPVRAVQSSNLTATYSNGTAGVGATLTNSGTQAALLINGSLAANVNDRILVQSQSTAYQNGVYVVTNVGSVSTNWVLTRAADYNSASNIFEGSHIQILEGSGNGTSASCVFVLKVTGTIIIGTTSLPYAQVGSTVNSISCNNLIAGGGVSSNINTVTTGVIFKPASNQVNLNTPASVATTFTLTMPNAQGAAGQALVNTDGAGTLGWSSSSTVWTSQATSVTLVPASNYISTNASLNTFSLPAAAAVGDQYRIAGVGAGKYTIAQNAGQNIAAGASSTTVGISGSVTANEQYCAITLLCVVANTTWIAFTEAGSFAFI